MNFQIGAVIPPRPAAGRYQPLCGGSLIDTVIEIIT